MAFPLQAEEQTGIGTADPPWSRRNHDPAPTAPAPPPAGRTSPARSSSCSSSAASSPAPRAVRPGAPNLAQSLQPPWFAGGSVNHILGTDDLGPRRAQPPHLRRPRSLLVSLAVVLLAGTIGVSVAVIAGYKGGRLDAFLMRTTDASLAFPVILLAIVIVGIYGASTSDHDHRAGLRRLAVVRPRVAQRGAAPEGPGLRDPVAGDGRRGTLGDQRHVLPNIVPTLLVLASLQIGLAIITEAGSASSASACRRPPRHGAGCWPTAASTSPTRGGWRDVPRSRPQPRRPLGQHDRRLAPRQQRPDHPEVAACSRSQGSTPSTTQQYILLSSSLVQFGLARSRVDLLRQGFTAEWSTRLCAGDVDRVRRV